MNEIQTRGGALRAPSRGELRSSSPSRDYILLDASGSMSSKWTQSLSAIDTYVESLRAGGLASHVTLTTFASLFGFEFRSEIDVLASEWTSCLSVPNINGSTPLFDAINTAARILRAEDEEAPLLNCSILIVTDGVENSSQTSATHARAILDWCRAKGWTVTFLGCDFNNLTQARELGLDDTNAIGVSTKRLSDVTRTLASKRIAFARGAEGIDFSNSEKEQFGGYLEAPRG